jgi:hypothetical protein
MIVVSILSVFAKLIAFGYLAMAGLLLFLEAGKKKSVKYWGLGLLVLSVVALIDLFAFNGTKDIHIVLYLFRRFFAEIAMIVFLFHGTLLLLLREKHANILTILYFIGALVADFTLNNVLSNGNLLNLAYNHIYVTLPLSVVFFSYFFTYHIELNHKDIMRIALSWGILFVVTLLFMITSSIGFTMMQEVFILIEYCVFIYISFSFNDLRKTEGQIWNQVTTPKNYVIDHNFLDFLKKEFGSKAEDAIKAELDKEHVENIYKMTTMQKELFLDNLFLNHFPEQSSQRKSVLKTKAIELLGLQQDSGHWRTAGS